MTQDPKMNLSKKLFKKCCHLLMFWEHVIFIVIGFMYQFAIPGCWFPLELSHSEILAKGCNIKFSKCCSSPYVTLHRVRLIICDPIISPPPFVPSWTSSIGFPCLLNEVFLDITYVLVTRTIMLPVPSLH